MLNLKNSFFLTGLEMTLPESHGWPRHVAFCSVQIMRDTLAKKPTGKHVGGNTANHTQTRHGAIFGKGYRYAPPWADDNKSTCGLLQF